MWRLLDAGLAGPLRAVGHRLPRTSLDAGPDPDRPPVPLRHVGRPAGRTAPRPPGPGRAPPVADGRRRGVRWPASRRTGAAAVAVVGRAPGSRGPPPRHPGPTGLAWSAQGARVDGGGPGPGRHHAGRPGSGRSWPHGAGAGAPGRRGPGPRAPGGRVVAAPPGPRPAPVGRGVGGRRRRLRGRGVDRLSSGPAPSARSCRPPAGDPMNRDRPLLKSEEPGIGSKSPLPPATIGPADTRHRHGQAPELQYCRHGNSEYHGHGILRSMSVDKIVGETRPLLSTGFTGRTGADHRCPGRHRPSSDGREAGRDPRLRTRPLYLLATHSCRRGCMSLMHRRRIADTRPPARGVGRDHRTFTVVLVTPVRQECGTVQKHRASLRETSDVPTTQSWA